MTAHCGLETLSTFVDDELPEEEHRAVEVHLRSCRACRSRLAGLERVTGHIRRLEQVAAPPTLGWSLERRLRLEREKLPVSRRLERYVGAMVRQPHFAPLFALVVAFGVILYVFSLGVSKQAESDTTVVIGGVETPESRGEQQVRPRGLAADSQLATQPGPEEEGADARSRAGRTGELESPILILADRRFVLVQGLWIESGLPAGEPDERIDLAAGGVLPEALGELRGRPGTYRLLLGQRRVEVVVPDAGGDR